MTNRQKEMWQCKDLPPYEDLAIGSYAIVPFIRRYEAPLDKPLPALHPKQECYSGTAYFWWIRALDRQGKFVANGWVDRQIALTAGNLFIHEAQPYIKESYIKPPRIYRLYMHSFYTTPKNTNKPIDNEIGIVYKVEKDMSLTLRDEVQGMFGSY